MEHEAGNKSLGLNGTKFEKRSDPAPNFVLGRPFCKASAFKGCLQLSSIWLWSEKASAYVI